MFSNRRAGQLPRRGVTESYGNSIFNFLRIFRDFLQYKLLFLPPKRLFGIKGFGHEHIFTKLLKFLWKTSRQPVFSTHGASVFIILQWHGALTRLFLVGAQIKGENYFQISSQGTRPEEVQIFMGPEPSDISSQIYLFGENKIHTNASLSSNFFIFFWNPILFVFMNVLSVLFSILFIQQWLGGWAFPKGVVWRHLVVVLKYSVSPCKCSYWFITFINTILLCIDIKIGKT